MGNCQTLIAGSVTNPASKPNGHSHVMVTTYTWARDSHGLFDYESKSLTKKVFKAQGTGVIRRSTNDIGFTKEGDKTIKLGDKDLLKLNLRQGNFWIDPCVENESKLNKEQTMAANDPSSLEQDPWLVIKSFKTSANKGYKLNQGDLIKLGRVKYRIREIKGTPTLSTQKNENPEKQVVNTEVDNNISVDDSFKKSPRTKIEAQGSVTQSCRICLSETCDPGDPFFSPCNCSGTMKLIHVKCLQTWLKSKLHVKNTGNTTFIYWKNLECELCKTPYPQSFEVENKRYDVVEIERPNCAYIVVEVLSKEKNMARGVHLIKMEGKNNIRLGRGHDSDIRITDISVSRCHAIIKLDKGNFYIEDNNSKFGTLLHLNKAIPITGEYNNISVQIGRTILSLTPKKGRGLFPICFGQNSTGNNSLAEKNPEFSNGIFEQNEPNSPVNSNSPVSLTNVNNRAVSLNLNVNNRERNYRVDVFRSSSLVLQNSPVAAESRVQVPNQHLQNPVLNNVRQPSLSENEGNVGEEADERSFYN